MTPSQATNQHKPTFRLGIFLLILVMFGALLLAGSAMADRVYPPTPVPALPETGSGIKPSCGCEIIPTPARPTPTTDGN
jgi:hypothetical protein